MHNKLAPLWAALAAIVIVLLFGGYYVHYSDHGRVESAILVLAAVVGAGLAAIAVILHGKNK